MRIIAGSRKGRTLLAPEGETTRPTHERTREALFSSLGTRVLGARVLDAFAGTGALGLEALSRGAASATFIDQDAAAVAVIQHNINACAFADVATIYHNSAISVVNSLLSTPFDLVFLDPPYGRGLIPPLLEAIAARGLLSETALLLAETETGETLPLPPAFEEVKAKRYGRNLVHYLTPSVRR